MKTAVPAARLCLLALTLATALVSAGSLPISQSPAPAASATRPRLVVFVAVDQMRADYLERFKPIFSAGFKRIHEQGAVFTRAFYRHACTETGPGHSVVMSGRSPRSSGIVGNQWYDRTLKARVNVVEDRTVRVVGGVGRAASPANYNAFTVGDMLKAHSPGSKVVGVSFKDRSAILPSGRRADGAYWYESSNGRFVTSSWYVEEAPRWLDEWNARKLPDGLAGRVWERLLPDASLYVRYAGEDAVDGEWDRKDVVFPHRIRSAPPAHDFYDDLRRTPFADEILLDFALAAMRGHDLGTDEVTDVLTVSFSATDVIGHTYGADSQEQMDNLLRLDRTLGSLMDAVEERAGKGRVLYALSADHGALPLVEVLKKNGVDARRGSGSEVHEAVVKALEPRYPDAKALFADADPLEYVFDREVVARRGLKLEELEAATRDALLATGFIEKVYTQRELMQLPPGDDPYFDRHQRAFFAPRSGDLIARVKPYVYLGGYVGGSGHGSPHDYDRHVPVVFMGPGVRPGPRDAGTGPEDIAWALGRLLGLPYPQQDAVTDLLPLLR
jgi:predicted AlkP superfamily pyrophosphatase or phosphodiesterase